MPDMPEDLVNAVYVTYRFLCMDFWPMYAHRRRGMTLFVWDPRATRRQIMERLVDEWTPFEQVALRRAWGQPDTGPIADWITEDAPVLLYVPPQVRLAGEPAMQGGAELEARRAANDLHHEQSALIVERFGGATIRYLSNLEPA